MKLMSVKRNGIKKREAAKEQQNGWKCKEIYFIMSAIWKDIQIRNVYVI